MHSKRFKLDIARREFDCYDCRYGFEQRQQFAWDNLRNCKICSKCLDKLSKFGDASNGSLSENITQQKVYWDISMLPTKPWSIGNYDINSWPAEIQREYASIAQHENTYSKGLKAAINKLSIYMETTKDGVIKVWQEVNTVTWSPTSMKELSSHYVQHLASLTSMEIWNKPCTSITLF
jgi:hypothetical protein